MSKPNLSKAKDKFGLFFLIILHSTLLKVYTAQTKIVCKKVMFLFGFVDFDLL